MKFEPNERVAELLRLIPRNAQNELLNAIIAHSVISGEFMREVSCLLSSKTAGEVAAILEPSASKKEIKTGSRAKEQKREIVSRKNDDDDYAGIGFDD